MLTNQVDPGEQRLLGPVFTNLLGQSFSEQGISDDESHVYISGLLVRFNRTDRLYRKDEKGRDLKYVDCMQDAARRCQSAAQRAIVYQYAGDFCLFKVGFFPESIRAPGSEGFYITSGKDFYAQRYEHSNDGLFAKLSDCFEAYASAIKNMRDGVLAFNRLVIGSEEGNPAISMNDLFNAMEDYAQSRDPFDLHLAQFYARSLGVDIGGFIERPKMTAKPLFPSAF